MSEFTDDILLNINQNKCTLAAFGDLRKAFDTVNHQILIQKLIHFGLHKDTVEWIVDYLSSRTQKTFANSILSSGRPITCGVPQGSILGPLLFLIYVNDLSKCLQRCQVRLYADDTVIYSSNTNPLVAFQDVQNDMSRLLHWCNKNQLTMNIKKTKSMFYGTKKMIKVTNLSNIKLGNDELQYVNKFSYLGIKLDNTLNFEVHAKETFHLVSNKIATLAKIWNYINQRQALNIYKSKVLPHFDYGDVLYHESHKRTLDKLQNMQNRGLRICLRAPPRTEVRELHVRSKVPYLVRRREAHLLNFMHKRKNHIHYQVARPRNTRLFEAVIVNEVRANKKAVERSVYCKGARAWNALPASIRNIQTYDAFKANRRTWLLQSVYDSEMPVGR